MLRPDLPRVGRIASDVVRGWAHSYFTLKHLLKSKRSIDFLHASGWPMSITDLVRLRKILASYVSRTRYCVTDASFFF